MKTIELCNVKSVPFQDHDQYTPDTKSFHFFDDVPRNPIEVRGFTHYLAKAWSNHYPVKVTPTDIWYMVICELTLAIAKQPKNFAHLFTTTPDSKQTILIPTNDPRTINLDMLTDRIKDCVPTDSETFLPQFSTDTKMTKFSLNVAFCDMVSPY